MRKGSSKCRVLPIIAPFSSLQPWCNCLHLTTRNRLAKHTYSSRYRVLGKTHVQLMILPSSFVIMGADGLRLLFWPSTIYHPLQTWHLEFLKKRLVCVDEWNLISDGERKKERVVPSSQGSKVRRLQECKMWNAMSGVSKRKSLPVMLLLFLFAFPKGSKSYVLVPVRKWTVLGFCERGGHIFKWQELRVISSIHYFINIYFL